MPFGAAALALHLVPRVELNVGGLDENLFVALVYLLLQAGHVHPGEGVSVKGDQFGRDLNVQIHALYLPKLE